MSLKSLLSKSVRGTTFNHLHTQIGYEDLLCETKPTGRKYITPEGTSYPSITTVLGSLSKAGIDAWKKRVGEEEANKIGHHACTRGTAMHEAIERYLNNDEEWFAPNEMPNVKALFNAIRPVLDERITNIYLQEAALYSDHLKLAGRVDCVAEFDGKLSIIDFKTAKQKKKKEYITSYFMQTYAYAIMFEERTGIPITQTVILMAVDDSPTPLIFKETRDNYTKQLLETIKNYYEATQ